MTTDQWRERSAAGPDAGLLAGVAERLREWLADHAALLADSEPPEPDRSLRYVSSGSTTEGQIFIANTWSLWQGQQHLLQQAGLV